MKPLRARHRGLYFALLGTVWVLLALLILVDLLLLTSPVNPWFHAAVIISGSMEPTIRTGSMVIITREDEYYIGDIIAFDDPLVGKNTHRVIDIRVTDGVTYYVTRGDAVDHPDIFMNTEERVEGKVRVILPWLGYVAYAGFAALLVPLALLLLYAFGKMRSRRNV